MKQKSSTQTTIKKTDFPLKPDMEVCQSDYPVDWYQEEFIPYAEEYFQLPNRKVETIIPWMKSYIEPVLKYFGDSLLLLAHYYMGGDIVKLVQQFGGKIGDSYQLALIAANHPEKKFIIESAVHFMAESISILSHPDQKVYITNPKAGCTMEMYAKDYMVQPAIHDLNERYGKENILPICYVNTSGRVKAMTGKQGGAACTSSCVQKIFEWALKQHKKILFIPDQHMGENVASWVGIPAEDIAYWPSGNEGAHYNLLSQDQDTLEQFDRSQLILFSSFCGVHTYYQPEMVQYWQQKGYSVIVHPECRKITADAANAHGSTAKIYDYVFNDRAGTKKYAIGTENHMVQNMKQICLDRGIEVVNVGDAPLSGFKGMGCGCATMSRNDPPHLVATLDLLRQGKAPEYNIIEAGDVVNEFTGTRERLHPEEQQELIHDAKIALNNMIKINEA